jgi:aspartate beta-hydroxylase
MTEEEADALLALEPADLAGLIAKADWRLAAGDERSATTFYTAALRAAERLGAVPPALAGDLRRARTMVARAGGNYRAHLEQWLAEAGLAPERVSDRFRRSIEILFGERSATLAKQRPSVFYFDGLPQREFYERESFAWLAGLEAATDAIRDELSAVLADERGVTPYVRPEPNRPHHDFHGLLNDPSWSAFYLIEDGEPHPVNAVRCPRTLEALAEAPLCRMPGWTPSVHFSLLRPGARIPPHTGMLNTRLICHLPLVVPPGCALRVGGETRAWEEGKALVFDDSIVHEAWNGSDRLRAILLFDIWRPELTGAEREAVAAMFAAIDAYRGA